MWSNFIRKIVSLLHFLSGKTTIQLTSQVDELKANLNERKANLNELKANINELKVKVDADQGELRAGQGELKAGQEMAIDTICRGLVMIVNGQNQILERLDDLEVNVKEIKKENRIEEYSHRK
jgi:archaellum component FlaC